MTTGEHSHWPEADAIDRLYPDLKRLAATYMKSQPPGHTLQATALVNQAYVQLSGKGFKDLPKHEFMALAATVMRRILINHARSKGALKRGGGKNQGCHAHRVGGQGTGPDSCPMPHDTPVRLTLKEVVTPGPEIEDSGIDILALHEALNKLAQEGPRPARVVELRYFGGLSVDEVALVLGVSKRTVESDWTFARSWLRRELER